ncbi:MULTISPECIES: sensor histidine kinase [unclassified Lentilitoribacter]|jgi:signal transduction histidine kinase|uniref:sensor histidine kinase n=1 Tax=unclassified Lentilitoribacter TaxID=2647570 RepID=UPI0013A69794|nr:HAMP domain-containing sensor histidine kinase [Lentilitoribacter sp. Alg239-R112]
MPRLQAMLKTTAVRLSLLYLVLFVVSATVLVFYVSSQSEGLLRAQTERAINREVRAVSNAYRSGGVNNLVRFVERRSRQPGSNLYIIASPTGEIFGGNVAEIEAGVFDKEGDVIKPFNYKKFGDFEAEYIGLGHVMQLPNGFKLLVGRDLDEPNRFGDLIERALITALAIMGVGALAIWFFVGRSALKRIDRMSLASERIMAGDLSQRLPVMGSGDEFDRLSDSLNTMLGRIERLNEGLRQVSDNIAHDLKTPLTRLRNRAEAALASEGKEDHYRSALEDMISESDQLIRIFSALLMISRVESGSAAAQLSKISLSAAANDAAELYEPVAEDSDVELIGQIADNLNINGNRELIGQALTNLIDNAIKYASGHETSKIWIKLANVGDKVHLTVADNGVGIPEDKHGEVIKRFVRLDESRNMPGTGLGLSLVEAVMRLHGGELKLGPTDLNDKEHPGLSVTMIFPMKI